MTQTTTLRIQNLVNRGLKDQDRDWIIRIRCFKTPIAVNQNSTYSFFKLDQPWLKTTTLRIQNLVNRGLKDQDRDWIIRIRCFKTPIAVNQNSTYSFFKLDQP